MTAAAAVSVARWASRRFANRGQTVRLRVKTARAARRRSAFANSFRRCGTPDSASPQPAGINIGKRRLCPCGCQPHRMDGLHFRLCPGALGDQPVMLDAAMLVEIALDLVAELEVEGCERGASLQVDPALPGSACPTACSPRKERAEHVGETKSARHFSCRLTVVDCPGTGS